MIKIKNWKQFQHYSKRCPPWIRLYRDILDDVEFHEMSGADFKALVMMWLIASEDKDLDGKLPDSKALAFRLRLSVQKTDALLSRLNHWIISDASNVLAECKQDATSDQIRSDQIITEKSMSAGYPADVLAIWDITPEKGRRRSSKKQLADAWKALRPKPAIDDVIDGLERFKLTEEWMKDGGQYIPGIHVWVKNRKWEVETKPAHKPKTPQQLADEKEAAADRRRMIEMGGFK